MLGCEILQISFVQGSCDSSGRLFGNFIMRGPFYMGRMHADFMVKGGRFRQVVIIIVHC
jgi:hypothetical protein